MTAKKGKLYASRSIAARKARGRPIVQVSMPQAALDWLDIEAKTRGISRSAVVVALIEERLKGEP